MADGIPVTLRAGCRLKLWQRHRSQGLLHGDNRSEQSTLSSKGQLAGLVIVLPDGVANSCGDRCRVPAAYILPTSATITHTPSARAGYDQALDCFSRPLMARYKSDYRFGNEQLLADGIRSNFHFDAYDDALFAWRFPDMTSQVAYLSEVISTTISGEMRQEASYLRNIMSARESVKNLIEAPNADIDQIIRSLRENGWAVSNKLKKAFPLLDSVPGLSDRVIAAVRAVFDPASPDQPDD